MKSYKRHVALVPSRFRDSKIYNTPSKNNTPMPLTFFDNKGNLFSNLSDLVGCFKEVYKFETKESLLNLIIIHFNTVLTEIFCIVFITALVAVLQYNGFLVKENGKLRRKGNVLKIRSTTGKTISFEVSSISFISLWSSLSVVPATYI